MQAGGLSRASIMCSLTSQWINGTASADQLSIAKSLIKLRLTPGTAPSLAQTTGVDPVILTGVATNIANGTDLTTQQTDAIRPLLRDLLLTTLLDQAYQRADQRYRQRGQIRCGTGRGCACRCCGPMFPTTPPLQSKST